MANLHSVIYPIMDHCFPLKSFKVKEGAPPLQLAADTLPPAAGEAAGTERLSSGSLRQSASGEGNEGPSDVASERSRDTLRAESGADANPTSNTAPRTAVTSGSNANGVDGAGGGRVLSSSSLPSTTGTRSLSTPSSSSGSTRSSGRTVNRPTSSRFRPGRRSNARIEWQLEPLQPSAAPQLTPAP